MMNTRHRCLTAEMEGPEVNSELTLGTKPGQAQAIVSEWDRLPKEPRRAYEAFPLYRDHQGPRCLDVVAGMLSCPLSRLTSWSTRWNWQERCRAFDIDQNEREQADVRRERRGMRRRQSEAARLMLAVGDAALLELQGKVEQGKTKLTPQDIVSLMRTGSVLERRARGEGVPERPDRSFTKIEVFFGDRAETKPRSEEH